MDRSIRLVPVSDEDRAFLQRVYASTRRDEVASTGWPRYQIDAFLAMQFEAQDRHYREYFPRASFDRIDCDGEPAGRLYVDRTLPDIRIVDIALMPAFRGRGIGTVLLKELLAEGCTEGRAVSIHVEKNNPAWQWYQRLGFVPVEDKGVYEFMQFQPVQQAQKTESTP